MQKLRPALCTQPENKAAAQHTPNLVTNKGARLNLKASWPPCQKQDERCACKPCNDTKPELCASTLWCLQSLCTEAVSISCRQATTSMSKVELEVKDQKGDKRVDVVPAQGVAVHPQGTVKLGQPAFHGAERFQAQTVSTDRHCRGLEDFEGHSGTARPSCQVGSRQCLGRRPDGLVQGAGVRGDFEQAAWSSQAVQHTQRLAMDVLKLLRGCAAAWPCQLLSRSCCTGAHGRWPPSAPA